MELARIIRSHAAELRRYVSSRISPAYRDRISVEDVLQDTWVWAFRTGASLLLAGPEAVRRSLWTMAERRLVDAIRKVRSLRRGGAAVIVREADQRASSREQLLDAVQGRERTPSRYVRRQEAMDAMLVALGSLPEPRRLAVHLRHIEGWSVKQIAAYMQRSEPAVHGLLFHGIRQLRERMGDAERYLSDAGSSAGRP